MRRLKQIAADMLAQPGVHGKGERLRRVQTTIKGNARLHHETRLLLNNIRHLLNDSRRPVNDIRHLLNDKRRPADNIRHLLNDKRRPVFTFPRPANG